MLSCHAHNGNSTFLEHTAVCERYPFPRTQNLESSLGAAVIFYFIQNVMIFISELTQGWHWAQSSYWFSTIINIDNRESPCSFLIIHKIFPSQNHQLESLTQACFSCHSSFKSSWGSYKRCPQCSYSTIWNPRCSVWSLKGHTPCSWDQSGHL